MKKKKKPGERGGGPESRPDAPASPAPAPRARCCRCRCRWCAPGPARPRCGCDPLPRLPALASPRPLSRPPAFLPPPPPPQSPLHCAPPASLPSLLPPPCSLLPAHYPFALPKLCMESALQDRSALSSPLPPPSAHVDVRQRGLWPLLGVFSRNLYRNLPLTPLHPHHQPGPWRHLSSPFLLVQGAPAPSRFPNTTGTCVSKVTQCGVN